MLACVVVLLVPAVAPAQEVFKEISPERLEGILSGMSLQFTKADGGKGIYYYTYKRKNLDLRLTDYNGKDLMIDIYLPAIDMKDVNRWNRMAKFSRASLGKDANKKDSVILESNLDLLGGVTEDTIKHFIRTFDSEITSFGKFTLPAVALEDTYRGIPTAKLEKILKDLKIDYKKDKTAGKDNFYNYTKNNYSIRISNFGNEDLMIDCVFPPHKVEKINAWNVRHNYVRAVLYPGNGNPYTALEANLDCMGGTSDSIISYFITSFDVEVREFDNYLKK
jgi:uncharacterized ubiquitin-like protein YukD